MSGNVTLHSLRCYSMKLKSNKSGDQLSRENILEVILNMRENIPSFYLSPDTHFKFKTSDVQHCPFEDQAELW